MLHRPELQLVVEVGLLVEDVPWIEPLSPGPFPVFSFLKQGVGSQTVFAIPFVVESEQTGHALVSQVEVAHCNQSVSVVHAHFAGVEHGALESGTEVLGQRVVNEPLESRFVLGVERFFVGVGLGMAVGHGESGFHTSHDFALARGGRVMLEVHADVDHAEQTFVDAQQVHFVQHHRSTKPP